jgi:hypothetical protein
MRRRGFLRGLGAATGAAALGRLGAGPAEAAPRQSLATRLATLDASLGVRVTRFERSHPVAVAEARLPPAGSGGVSLALERARVGCRVRASDARDRDGATDLEVAFRVSKTSIADAELAVTLTIASWSRDAYLLIPGAAYAGNRFESRHLPYPPLLAESSDIGPHVPPIIGDLPRLNAHAGPSRIALRAADTASPALGVRLPGSATGLLLLSAPTSSLGEIGLGVEEDEARRQATLVLSAPAVRPDVRFTLQGGRSPSTDRGAALAAGATVTLRLRVVVFPCPDVQALFDRWFEARRDVLGPARFDHQLPFSAARSLIAERLERERWSDPPGSYLATPRPAPLGAARPPPGDQAPRAEGAAVAAREPAFQLGWDGPLALAVPLGADRADETARRAGATLEFLLRGQAASGLLRAASDGERWWNEGEAVPSPPSTATGAAGTPGAGGARGGGTAGALVRRWTSTGRNVEALYQGLKLWLLLARRQPSRRPPERWRTGLRRCADALVRLWDRHRQLGQHLAVDTGEVAVGGSTAGALAPAALALAARAFSSEAYLAAATAMATAYHQRYVRAGLTLGGAPAALQCPDSRSAAGLLESFVTLGEVSGDGAWFGRAEDSARQLASWIIAFDARLPDDSMLGRLRARTTGAVLVSVQDKWALPSFAGISGDALFRLYRATGQTAYLDLLRETAHNATQYVAHPHRLPENGAGPGWVLERVALGDAMGPPGEVPAGTAGGAAEAACLWSMTEVPSIYVQPDAGFVFTFDHVETEVRERSGSRLVIAVRNPTGFEAELKILAELESERHRPLGPWAILGARTLTLPAGATDELVLPLAGV